MIRAPSLTVPSGPTKWRSKGSASRTEQVGQHRGGRLALGVAVLGRLDDLGVDAEGHVVDEDPPVHLGQVDAPLDRGVEGVERAEDVVAVEPEVEGEVVAGAGRDADQRDVGGHRHAGHQRLRPVPARHADHVGPPVDRALGELEQVVPGLEDHRLDAASAALLGQREALRLAATGPQVHDEDAARGRGHLACRGAAARAAPAVADAARSGRGRWTRRAARARRRGPGRGPPR